MVEIGENVYWVGVNDRTTDLFESVWPLPNGVSYNSYIIDDDKKVLIDTVKKSFTNEYLKKIKNHIKPEEIDYIIVNHMEPDHSGSLPAIRRIASEATIIGTQKTKDLLESFYDIKDNVKAIDDEEELNIGDKTLKFYETPFVHWPETMMTQEINEKILFSGDAFGGFGALDGGIFDDQMDLEFYDDQILRYFSNIIGMHSHSVQSALKKLGSVDIETVAPTHGLVWRNEPSTILEHYDKWSSMEGEKGVTIIYGSMYGNTREMMESVAKGVKSVGCKNFKVLDASRKNLSFLLKEAWRRKGLIIGSPTYDARIFPPVDQFMNIVQKKRLQNRVAGVFGSYGWSGGAVDKIKSSMEKLGWEVEEPTAGFNGFPDSEELERGEELGKKIGKRALE